MAQEPRSVAVFWDYENCFLSGKLGGHAVVQRIRDLLQSRGPIKVLRAYIPREMANLGSARSDLQSSGVSIINVPRNGRKDVADKMIMVDILAHAMDNLAANSTIVLISGDRDFAYAVSMLRLRQYEVVVITLPNTHYSLTAQASATFDWFLDVLGHSKDRAALTFRRRLDTPADAVDEKLSRRAQLRKLERLGPAARSREASGRELESKGVEEADVMPESSTKTPPNPPWRDRLSSTSPLPPRPSPSTTFSRKPGHRLASTPKVSHHVIPQFESGLRKLRLPLILQTLFTLYRIPVYQRRVVLLDIIPRFSKRPSKIFANFYLSKMKTERSR